MIGHNINISLVDGLLRDHWSLLCGEQGRIQGRAGLLPTKIGLHAVATHSNDSITLRHCSGGARGTRCCFSDG